MIDLHCHILPGLDDGAFSTDDSLKMASVAVKNGTRGICCTPHAGPYTNEQLLYVFNALKHALSLHHIPLTLFLGQEIYLTENYASQIRDITKGHYLTINNTPYVLAEFAPDTHSRIFIDAVDMFSSCGLIPIIAHPERYEAIHDDGLLAAKLKAGGALLQLNKGSLKGFFGYSAMKAAFRILDEQTADFVASDAHSPYARTPNLREVHAFISEHYSIEYADHLLINNPTRVVSNLKIHSCNR